jgi:hypothetical protein
MNRELAHTLLTRSFSPGETAALLLRFDGSAKVMQRIARLSFENADGANIHIAANPLRSAGRKCTKKNIASARHLYIDIDEDGDTRLAALTASKAVPAPAEILWTSPGKYRTLWRLEGFDFDMQQSSSNSLPSHSWRSCVHRPEPHSSSSQFPEL